MTTIDCIIVGGGFTGLAAGLDLAGQGKSVTVLEADASVGGLAGGFDIGGFELEKFYHHWFTNDAYVTDLVRDIDQSANIVTRPSLTGMYFAKSFYRLSTPLDLIRFKALPFHDRIRTGLATLSLRRIKDWKALEGLTAREWLTQVFGKKAFEVVWEPLLVGKFGEYAEEVSAVWFWKKLALRGSSRGEGGKEMLAYYRGGFAQLARSVAAEIEKRGGKVQPSTKVKSIRQIAPGDVEVTTTTGVLRAKNVLVTTPFPDAADMLEGNVDSGYIARLRRIKYLANVCLVLEMDRSLSGIYWLNVNDPAFPFVGVIEHTNFEPPESYGGRHIAYLSRYLSKSDWLYGKTPKEVFDFAVPHLKRMFPEFNESWVKAYHVWQADSAQPIAEKHYSKLVPGFETPLQDVFISTMAQVYPEDRGTNYAIREGRAAAAAIAKRLGVMPAAVSSTV